MLTSQEVNAIGQICQTSWAKSSDNMRVTHSLAGDILQLTMNQIVHFAREKSLELQTRHLHDVSNDIFTDAIKTFLYENACPIIIWCCVRIPELHGTTPSC